MATLIAVIAALGAACCFALAAVVQHGVARATEEKLLRPAPADLSRQIIPVRAQRLQIQYELRPRPCAP